MRPVDQRDLGYLFSSFLPSFFLVLYPRVQCEPRERGHLTRFRVSKQVVGSKQVGKESGVSAREGL